MKIGILTYHSVYNFGANLQVYSTYQYLVNNSFDPIVIDYIPIELEEGYKRGHSKVQIEAHENFINQKLSLTEKCRSIKDVAKAIEVNKISAVFIGSDAVLQHKGLLSRMYLTRRGIKFNPKRSNLVYPNPFWGSFLSELSNKIPVSVFSASSQNTDYKIVRGRKRREIGKAIKRFDQISVRDEWTKKMVKYFTFGKINPVVTPDPVFAFNNNIIDQPSKKEITEKYKLSEKYVLFSFKNQKKVSLDWLLSCQKALNEKGIEMIYLTMPWGIGEILEGSLKIKTILPPLCPQDWYSLIKYSAGYVGENMHPIIVCLHNSVPFFSFDSYGIIKYKYFINDESSKIYHILEKADFLQHRISLLGKNYKCPNPESVLDKLDRFDKEKCTVFSEKQQLEYFLMMENLTNFHKNKMVLD